MENDRKCKHIFMIPHKDSEHKGLIFAVSVAYVHIWYY